MESAIVYGIFYLFVGAILLFFGAKFIKLAVGLLGVIIGFNIGHALFYHSNLTGWLETTLTIGLAVLVAVLAIRFYKLFITLSISYTAGTITYGILNRLDANVFVAIGLSVFAGVLIFLIIRTFQLVEALFALVTSAQGASAIVTGLLLFTNKELVDSLQHGNTSIIHETDYLWIFVWVVLLAFGLSFQMRNSK